jgi:hypothetical protein
MIDIEPKASLIEIESLGPVHVSDRDDDELKLEVHGNSLPDSQLTRAAN